MRTLTHTLTHSKLQGPSNPEGGRVMRGAAHGCVSRRDGKTSGVTGQQRAAHCCLSSALPGVPCTGHPEATWSRNKCRTHDCTEPCGADSYNTRQQSLVRCCDLICGECTRVQDQMDTMGSGDDGRGGWGRCFYHRSAVWTDGTTRGEQGLLRTIVFKSRTLSHQDDKMPLTDQDSLG